MAKDYTPQPGALIKVKATSDNSYEEKRLAEDVNVNTIYITDTPHTIIPMAPSNAHLNYMDLPGYISVSNSLTDNDLILDGFAKINLSDEDKEELEPIRKVDNNITDKFIIKISPKNDYFNLYIPVVDDV